MRAFGAPCGLRALSVMFAFNSSFILLPPCTLRPPLLALGTPRPGRPAPGSIPPGVQAPCSGAWLLHAPARVVLVRGAMRPLAFVGGFRAAEAFVFAL